MRSIPTSVGQCRSSLRPVLPRPVLPRPVARHREQHESSSVPERPRGRRPEVPRTVSSVCTPVGTALTPLRPTCVQHAGASFGPQVQFGAGVGFFPSLFGLQFVRQGGGSQGWRLLPLTPSPPSQHTFGAAPPRQMTPQEEQAATMSKMLLAFGCFVLFFLLFS